ncbi:MAG: hypothetical protein L3J04_01430, partial [Robiginitomaculum sp.]|nr:hypothetical protein [Robiginitomaculum sp.]
QVLDTRSGTQDLQVDASGYSVTRLEAMERFFFDVGSDNSGEENAEFIIQGLPETTILSVFNDPADLNIPAYDRLVELYAGVTVPGEFVFNNVNPALALANMQITFEVK